MPLRRPRRRAAAGDVALPLAFRLAARVVRCVVSPITIRDWRGVDHLPPAGGFVASQNHITHIDPLTLAHFLYDNGHPPYFLAKESLFRLPVLGRWIAATGQIPVYRHTNRAADAARAGTRAVREGKAVVIFPEGTLTRDPDLWPMTGHTGAARIALETRCPLIPVAQWGAQQILAPYGKRPRLFPRTTVHVSAGPPVDLSDLYSDALSAGHPAEPETLLEATDRLMAAITGLLEQIRGETAPVVRYDPRQHPGAAA